MFNYQSCYFCNNLLYFKNGGEEGYYCTLGCGKYDPADEKDTCMSYVNSVLESEC